MKRTIVMLAVAAASMIAFAQPPPNPAPAPKPSTAPASVSPPAAPLVKKETAQIPAPGMSTPLKNLSKPVVKNKIEKVDGMSSRPWAQIVGIHPGYSAFPPPELRDPEMNVFWIGRDPH